LVFTEEDSGSSQDNMITYSAYEGDAPCLSGGKPLRCQWELYDKQANIWQCDLKDMDKFTQLFVNGKRQHRARFPNYDYKEPIVIGNGYVNAVSGIVADPPLYPGQAPIGFTYNPDNFTTKTWEHPEEAILFIFSEYYWGNLMWRLSSINYNTSSIYFEEGGWQLSTKHFWFGTDIGPDSRFYIENVFEGTVNNWRLTLHF
jgi:hypothetical protein